MADFVHLHCHSEYSLLDGLSNIGRLCSRAKELGMSTLALTDHGVMYGAIEFYNTAKKHGIKPIIGVEAYVAPGRHSDKTQKGYFHTVLLAKNAIGYKNLLKLTTRAHLDGYYYKPRIDRELIEQHKEGLIISQACVSGEVNRRIMQSDLDAARRAAAFYRDMMGPDHYYLELQLHPEVKELDDVNKELVKIGKELGIPLVATNDAHFVDQQDAETHRLLRCLGWGTTLQSLCAKNPVLDDTYYLKSAVEMQELMRAYPTEAIENTLKIASMCDLELDFGRVQLPDFPIPEEHTPSSYLRELCELGLRRRFAESGPPQEYWDRLNYELDVIDQTGFPLYMLIVWDYAKFARARNIPCLPRGSAGGSLVVYCLGISDVDPVANKLVFERFLNPERKEMPDIDMDFADSRRQEVIDYVVQKYGRERTAQIITFGTLGAKAALRDVGRVMEVPLSLTDQVAKLIPLLPVGTTIDQALEKVSDLKKMYDSDPQVRNLIDQARRLEGVTRNVGTHACGVVVSRDPLEEIVPLQRTSKDENTIMASFPMGTLGDIGLLKMDMLGLANLSIVDAALTYISAEVGRPFSLADVPEDDAKTFETLSRGDTRGVFQLEGSGMTRYLVELKPNRVQDIYAMVALYRPGPLEQIPLYIENKRNPAKIKYLHPLLKPILEDTYGIITYQEQVLLILMQMAGYSMGQADIIRKAIGKKKRDLMEKEGPKFIEGCQKKGMSEAEGKHLWELILPFAGYSFNRAHATLYGLLAYQTAYLKTNYPTEYMAALLTSAAGQLEKVAGAVGECLHMGVAVLPPDINQSGLGFTIEVLPQPLPEGITHPKGIRFGLSAIKNVGEGPIKGILAARAEGPFTSLEDFCARVDRQSNNKRVLESLVKCGAFDGLPGTRQQKLAILDQAISAGADAQRAREQGQASIFELFGGAQESATVSAIPLPALPFSDDQRREQLLWEKELLGMYVSAHPVAQALQNAPPDPGRITLGQISDQPAYVGKKVTLIGMLSNMRRVTTKKNDTMLIAKVEDLDSEIEMVCFPKTYERFKTSWVDDAILSITAKVDERNGALQLICEEVRPYTETSGSAEMPLLLNPEELPLTEAGMAAGFEGEEPLPAEPGAEDWAGYAPTSPALISPAAGRPTEDAAPRVAPAARQELPAAATPTAAPPDSPAAPALTILPRPRRRVALNTTAQESNGEGAAAPAGPLYHLHIYLTRTSDFDRDVRTMQEIDRLLRSYAGDHRVTIYLPNAIGQVVLEPERFISPAQELISQLAAILGDDGVYLEQPSRAA